MSETEISQRTNRIARAFAGRKALIAFLTAGDPSLEDTARYVAALEEAGADLIELGIPFSDPIAEGPVIQEADLRSLAAGTTVEDCLALVRRLRAQTELPLVFMTYLNPVFHYGYERFFAACGQAGLDGIIIPDLPFEEQGELLSIAAAQGVTLISMIAPTSAERVALIARSARGFIYLVSSLGVTGVRSSISSDLAPLIADIRAVTDVPVAVGFGIHSPEQATELGALADGVIIGSAIVRLLADAASGEGERYEHEQMPCQATSGQAVQALQSYLAPIRAALNSLAD